MTRREAAAVFAVAVAMVVAGVVWIFGAWGLIGSGACVALLTLFVFDIREERRAEPVVRPSGPLARR